MFRHMSRGICLLLLGSSRFRYIYKYSDGICAKTSSLTWYGTKSDSRYGTMAGTLCANTSHFHSLSYFLHFGVSSDGVYHQKWTTHINSNWNGPGYTGQGVDSPLMLYEAILRFLHYFRGCEPRVVFSSYLWDIKRKQEYFYTMNDDVWISEFRTNFTRVLKTVSSLVRTTVEIPYGLTGARVWSTMCHRLFLRPPCV